jgi:O-antigen/teichoic acid export membrane protein
MPTERVEAPTETTQAFRSLRIDVALMASSKAFGLLFGVGSTVVIARELGPHGRGIIAVAFGLALVLVQTGTLGIVSANPYFVARDPKRRGAVVANSVWLALTVGLLLIACGTAVKLWLPGVVTGVSWVEMVIALCCIPTTLLALFLQSVLLGLGRSTAYNLTELAQAGLTLVALFLVLVVAHGGITAALIVMSAGPLAGAVAYALELHHGHPQRWRPDLELVRSMMSYAFRLYVATLLAFLVIRLDLLLVNLYRGSAQAGEYSIAATLAQGMYVFPAAIATNLFPRIAQGRGDELTTRVFRMSAIVYGVCCLLAIPVVGPGVHLLYGPRFSEAATLFYWLLPGVFSLGMVTVLANHFAGRGFPLPAMLVWFAGLGVNLAMNVVLLPRSGTYIASLASSVAYTLLLGLHVRMFANGTPTYRSLIPRRADFSLQAFRSTRAVP